MQQVQEGNKGAAEALYDRYFRRLCAFAANGFQVNHPEDLVQDVFIRLLENPKLFDVKYRFQTWIYTAVSNKCKNQIRNAKTKDYHHENMGFAGHVVYQHHEFDAKLIQLKINSIFDNFSMKEKQIYCLKYEHNLSHSEIAEIMEIPEGSVKSGLFYILKKLSHSLKPHLT